jgi:hypothetical protein
MLGKLLRHIGGSPQPRRMLDGFVDSLLQSFENCRAAVSDETIFSGEKAVQAFFLELYEKEKPRLGETVRLFGAGLNDSTQREMFGKVDELMRKVVVPAYARLATKFTRRERNDFYLVPEPLHGLERLGWGTAGMALGVFAVWAPFIPIWEKEWVLPFAVCGLFFPNIRRFLSTRRYQSDLNRIVAHADDEIWRVDLAFLTSETSVVRTTISEGLDSTGAAANGARRAEARKQGGR